MKHTFSFFKSEILKSTFCIQNSLILIILSESLEPEGLSESLSGSGSSANHTLLEADQPEVHVDTGADALDVGTEADEAPSQMLLQIDTKKLVFLGTAEEISTLRPYWTEATRGLADVVQPQTCMLEIIPSGVSKGSGVKMLLDHLGIATDEILPHFDGENKTMMQHASSSSSSSSSSSNMQRGLAISLLNGPA